MTSGTEKSVFEVYEKGPEVDTEIIHAFIVS
jgi:hypothetical protein